MYRENGILSDEFYEFYLQRANLKPWPYFRIENWKLIPFWRLKPPKWDSGTLFKCKMIKKNFVNKSSMECSTGSDDTVFKDLEPQKQYPISRHITM